MTTHLEKKIQQAIRLIKMAGADGDVVEVAYSGGKDSDVILQLAKEAGINYRAIYKNTTIDPPGTLKHVKDMGAEVVIPKENFFKIIERYGYPNRFKRFCCRYLKEYKILDKVIMGVRREESIKRANQYKEPTECRFYGSKKEHVEAIYPILYWTSEDIVDFINDRNIIIHPLYYREDGTIDPTRRVGCMCCPLASKNKRIEQFQQYPNMVKAYIRAGQRFLDTHKEKKVGQKYDAFTWFSREIFFERQEQWEAHRNGLFDNEVDYKAFLEEYFNIKL